MTDQERALEALAECRALVQRIERSGGPGPEWEARYRAVRRKVGEVEGALYGYGELGFPPILALLLTGAGLLSLVGYARVLRAIAGSLERSGDVVAQGARTGVERVAEGLKWGIVAFAVTAGVLLVEKRVRRPEISPA